MKKNTLHLTALILIAGTLSLAAPANSYAAPETEASVAVDLALLEEIMTDELEEQGIEVIQEALAVAREEVLTEATPQEDRRQEVVNYALQFVGGKYRAGGNDPHTGADCSGFVKYVMQNGAEVNMNRSSSAQASQGIAISSAEMQPGDLLFYSNGSQINHVAIYIGDGQIVHASTYKTGIKLSPWNYRAPVKIMNVLG